MVLRIERLARVEFTTLRVSGRLQGQHVEQLKAQIESCVGRVVLDLEEVKLIDRDAVRFLGACEKSGVELRQSSPYIRDWITREMAGQSDPSDS